MIKKLLTSLSGKISSRRNVHASEVCQLERLEQREMLAAGPHVTSLFADNRGQISIRFDQAMDPKTITQHSVQLIVTTSRGNVIKAPKTIKLSTNQKLLTITADNSTADRAYSLKLVASTVKSVDGVKLDGEFVAFNKPSGNGVAGGDYYFSATPYSNKFIARFTTSLGSFDVQLFHDQTPITVQNFLSYANRGLYDMSFIHNSEESLFAGGSWNVVNHVYTPIERDAMIQNEAQPGDPGNIRGTIAMNKLAGNVNSATNEWFFNTANNRYLDTANGGYTAFGQITTTAGLAVMDKINALSTVPIVLASGMDPSPVPVNNNNLVWVKRVAVRMNVKPG